MPQIINKLLFKSKYINKGRTLRNSPFKILKFSVLCTYTFLAEYNQLDLIDVSLDKSGRGNKGASFNFQELVGCSC